MRKKIVFSLIVMMFCILSVSAYALNIDLGGGFGIEVPDGFVKSGDNYYKAASASATYNSTVYTGKDMTLNISSSTAYSYQTNLQALKNMGSKDARILKLNDNSENIVIGTTDYSSLSVLDIILHISAETEVHISIGFKDAQSKIVAVIMANSIHKHVSVEDAAVEATCTSSGLTAGSHCSVCDATLIAQKTIPALGHEWDAGVVVKEATYTETGLTRYTCKRCGEILEVENLQISLGKAGWVQHANGSWSYGDAKGLAVTGVYNDGGTYYLFDDKGIMTTGWTYLHNNWYYSTSSGALYHGGWYQVNGVWYYFHSNGVMATGWLNDGGTYYYMKSDGSMATGWIEVAGTWYYMSGSGSMQTGWISSGGTWYYMDGNGKMVTGWQNVGGTWYYFKSSGAMATGWFRDYEAEKEAKKEMWYWADSNGAMATGWKVVNGQWEYFDASGLWQYTWDGN